MLLTRRALLKGMMLAGGYCLLPLGRRGWALAAPQAVQRHLIVIFMRGAVDGLSIVAPYGEPNYYHLRPTIAIPAPGQNEGLVNLDGFFGLHPSLAGLMPLWQNRNLAFIQASGSPSETRSHFEAQDIMETAMLNSALAKEGWMNSLAQILPDNHDPARALSFGNTLPKIFQGKYDVTTVPAELRPLGNMGENPQVEAAFGQLYGTHPELGGLYKQAVDARAGMMQDLQKEMQASAQGAPAVDGFTKQTTQAAEIIRGNPNIQLMFMDVGGWDTHVNQGNAKGQLANKLQKFGEGLAALAANLGPSWNDTTVLIVSEFGRTVAENGNAGTDHGHGNVAWIMGGRVNGGKVWSRWPGLDESRLHEGRDLAVTTDFRSIIGAVVAEQFDLDDQRIAGIIPGYAPDPGMKGIIG
jgi:uncharacterized protein (DUF1501 family)